MMPAIIAQLVALLKGTALGYVLGYSDLLNQIPKLDRNFHNLIPAAIVIAAIYIAMNTILGLVATWIEARTRRGGYTAGPVAHATETSARSGTAVYAMRGERLLSPRMHPCQATLFVQQGRGNDLDNHRPEISRLQACD